jgi:quercetin dioxygenase-like cupin family protein
MRITMVNPVLGTYRTAVLGIATVFILTGGLLVPLVAQAQDRDGERVLNVIEEPRHRPVHIDGDLYLLDVQLNPGDESYPHLHNAPILTTSISNGDGPVGGVVRSNTDYARESFTHAISNNGTFQTRIIAFINFGPALNDLAGDRPPATAGEPQLENEWFRSYRVELAPGEATPLRHHHNPAAVVQVSDGLVHVTRVDGITQELDSMGDWAWRDAESPFLIRNVGTEPVAVVINEGRRQ